MRTKSRKKSPKCVKKEQRGWGTVHLLIGEGMETSARDEENYGNSRDDRASRLTSFGYSPMSPLPS